MKKLIEEYQKKIEKKDEALKTIKDMIIAARKDPRIDADDLREEKANCNRDRQLYLQFIKDLEGSETLIILDYLIDNNKEHGIDSSGRSILRVEQGVFDKMKDITESVK